MLKESNQIKEEYKKKYNQSETQKNRFGGKKKYYEKELEKIDKEEVETLRKFVRGEIDEREKNIISEDCKKDRIEVENKLKEVIEEYEKYEVGEVVSDYLDVMMDELEKQYSIERLSDREVIINKYIEEVKVKYIGSEKENFKIGVRFTLKDNFEETTNRINKLDKNGNGGNNKNSIYISNHKSLQVCDLMYKSFLTINYVVEVEIWGMGMGYDIDKIELIEVS